MTNKEPEIKEEIGILDLNDKSQFEPDEDESKIKILIGAKNPKRMGYIWLKRPNPIEHVSFERLIPKLRDKLTVDFPRAMMLYLVKFALQPKFNQVQAESYIKSRPRPYFKELENEMMISQGIDRKELTKEALELAIKN